METQTVNIPLWIKLFAGGLGLILVFSLFTLPRSIKLGIALERGEKAVAARRYVTAQKELTAFLAVVPDHVEARGNLMIASFHNMDWTTFSDMYKKLQHVKIEDKDLFSQLDHTMALADGYVPDDVTDSFVVSHPIRPANEEAWENFIVKKSKDVYPRMLYASYLFDQKEYLRCDYMLQQALDLDSTYFPALLMEASVKREQGDAAAALRYNDKLLSENPESARGISSKARTLLRLKRDDEALTLAREAYRSDPADRYLAATVVLALHFKGMTAERDALIAKMSPTAGVDSSDVMAFQYALDVISKKEKFVRK